MLKRFQVTTETGGMVQCVSGDMWLKSWSIQFKIDILQVNIDTFSKSERELTFSLPNWIFAAFGHNFVEKTASGK